MTVDYATADETAEEGEDYTATNGTLTFASGQTSKTITVPIVDDNIEDNGETFTITLSNPTGGAGIVDSEAFGTIQNTEDDVEIPEVTALTAAFQSVPSGHDGDDDAFDVRILFDAPICPGSWTSVRDAITVTNGTHTKTHRVDGRSDLWNIGVEATSDADVTVNLRRKRCMRGNRSLVHKRLKTVRKRNLHSDRRTRRRRGDNRHGTHRHRSRGHARQRTTGSTAFHVQGYGSASI